MSSTRQSTTRLQVDIARLVDVVGAEHEAVLSGMCSRDVVRLAHEVSALPLDPAEEARRLDASLPEWRKLLPDGTANALLDANADASSIHLALNAAAAALAAQERSIVAAVSHATLTEQGYEVIRADGAHTTAIEAHRGHETYLVVVGDQGTIVTDHAGLADGACEDRDESFVAALAEHGVLLVTNESTVHGDSRGGTPILAAARAGVQSLAHGAVIAGDAAHEPLTGTVLEARPAQRAATRTRTSAS